jgi:hypothetical protein
MCATCWLHESKMDEAGLPKADHQIANEANPKKLDRNDKVENQQRTTLLTHAAAAQRRVARIAAKKKQRKKAKGIKQQEAAARKVVAASATEAKAACAGRLVIARGMQQQTDAAPADDLRCVFCMV